MKRRGGRRDSIGRSDIRMEAGFRVRLFFAVATSLGSHRQDVDLSSYYVLCMVAKGVEHGLCRSCGLVHLEVELTHLGWPRVERLWVSMLSRELILELTYWTPLVALLLLSLGLIALKRISGLPPW